MDITNDMDNFIRRLKQQRHAKNLSQLDLSNLSEVSQGYLASIETGRKVPTISTVFKLCHAMKISPVMLFEDDYKATIKHGVIDYLNNEL